MLTGTSGIETQDGYKFFLRKFAEWNKNSGKFDVQWNDAIVGAYTKIRLVGKSEIKVEIEFVLHYLAAMTFGEYLDKINDEWQKAVRKQYIDSFKL
jgi:hypothetical protein